MAHTDIASSSIAELLQVNRAISTGWRRGFATCRPACDDVILAVAVTVDQLAIALGLLDRVQVLALDILDQRDFGGASSMSRTIAGMAWSCAFCAARQRRSPAIIS